MLRLTRWQHEVSDNVSWHQDEALNATIFLLRNMGPTSFSLIEEGQAKKVKVNIGDPHTCTCDVFKKEKNPCKHICWVILKKFKWPRTNEITYQHGLVEREINQLLQGPYKNNKELHKKTHKKSSNADKKEVAEQRTISKIDVCSICQEEFLDNHLPVTYCKYGCGNSIHIKCMKIWAEHQRQSSKDDEIKCPICREIFGNFHDILEEFCNASGDDAEGHRLDVHFSTSCNTCNMCPIKGKCYKCLTCSSVYLCNTCFHANKHTQHSFEFRIKRTHRWRPAKSRQTHSCSPLINDLSLRDITENDYDLLLQLDQASSVDDSIPVDLCGLPEHIINSLPLMKVRFGTKLLAPGKQCRICLRSYDAGDYVRKLPDCRHIFHRECIDRWLSEDHRRCPIDQKLVLGPSRRHFANSPKHKDTSRTEINSSNDISGLMIPGIGIAKLNASSNLRRNPDPKTVSKRHLSMPSGSSTDNIYSDVAHGFDTLNLHNAKGTSSTDSSAFHIRRQQRTNNDVEPTNRIARGSVVRKNPVLQTSPGNLYSDLWLTGNSPSTGI